MKKLTITLSLLVILNACTFAVQPKSDLCPLKDDVENSYEGCNSVLIPNMEYLSEDTYVSEEGDEYRVTIDYENEDDFLNSNNYSAKDIGMLAYLSTKVYAERNLPGSIWVKVKLQNIHVIVLHNQDTFARLRNPELYSQDPIAACGEAHKYLATIYAYKRICNIGVPEEANIYYIIRSEYMSYKNIWVSIHELMHPIRYYGIGDTDGEHKDKRFWADLSDDSIAAEVVERFENLRASFYSR